MDEQRELPNLSYGDAWTLAALGDVGEPIGLPELIDRMDFMERAGPDFDTFSFGLRRLEVVGYIRVVVDPDGQVAVTPEPAMVAVHRAVRDGIGITPVVRLAGAIGAPDLTDRVPDDRSFGPLPGFTQEHYERAYEQRSAEFEADLLDLPGFTKIGSDVVLDPTDPSFIDDVMGLREQLAPRLPPLYEDLD